jgi:hypothetical protein
MKKVLKLFLIDREEVKNKWWHRMINVFIYTSTLLVVCISIFLFVQNKESWKKYTYTSFNFEKNYDTARGQEVNCSVETEPFSASCDGKMIDPSDLALRHDKFIKDGIGGNIVKRICDNAEQERKLNPDTISDEYIRCLNLTYGKSYSRPISLKDFNNLTQEQIISIRKDASATPLPQSYLDKFLTEKEMSFVKQNDWFWEIGLKAKYETEIIYKILLKNIFYVILAISCWFIVWQSIIYRTILYIIYGNKK